MSLRHDQRASRKVTRAALRNTTALKRACESAIGPSSSWENLENRVMLSLVHAYPFNEDAGTTTADIAGTKPGTLYSNGAEGVAAPGDNLGVSWGTANPSPAGGSYLHFDSVAGGVAGHPTNLNNGGRVDLSPNNTLAESLHNEMGQNASVTTWIRVTNDGEVIGDDTMWQAPAITGNEQAGAGNDNFYGWLLSDGRVGMQKGDSASAISTSSIADGAWHLLAVTRNYDTGEARVFIDGRLQSSVTTSAGPVSSFWDSIGALTDVKADGLTLDGYNYMNNTDLDDVRMYNHILTQGEILSLIPASLQGALTAPTLGSISVDAADPRRINLTFTDSNTNEAGFIIERAIAGPTGQPGAFQQVAQLGSGSSQSYSEIGPDAFNQGIIYRVRAFNKNAESPNATFAPVVLTGDNAVAAVSAGYLNSNFWGANNRQWGVDPNPNDGAIAGNGAGGVDGGAQVGSINLTGDGSLRDPANPAGIDVRDPDLRAFFPGTQPVANGPFVFNVNWGNGSPNPAIRADNFTTIHTGKLNFTLDADANGDGTPGQTINIPFESWTDDDGWAYVNGVLVSTDPGGHGQRLPGNTLQPGLPAVEGQSYSWDVVVLQAEQGGGSGVGLKWNPPSTGIMDYIPMSNLTPMPSRPQASQLVLNGAAGAYAVNFNITDASTSEQRFELWRRPSSADTTGAGFVKVNEAGINAPFINDASVQPGQSYDYVLLGYNFASGYTDLAAAVANKVTVTTAAAPAVVPGLQARYFNDDFWGQGENRPLPRSGNFFVGAGGDTVGGADDFELAPLMDATHTLDTAATVIPGSTATIGSNYGTHAISMNYGDDNHDPAARPGGSPSALIRDNSHSTLWTGKLIITDPGSYQILGQSDDDGLVIVDNVITSADLAGHGLEDPRVTPNANDRFTNAITLTAGEHDIAFFQSEQGGGSGARLTWIRPGQTQAEIIPEANLSTKTSAPTAAGAPVVTAPRGTSAVVAAADNSTNELKNVVVLATDAAFTQNVRRIPVGIQVATGSPGGNPTTLRVAGLTPNTDYFVKVISMNFDGQAESATTTFNSGAEVVPAAPTNLAGRAIAPNQIRLTWTDNAIDETSFIIRRRRVGDATFTDVDTVPANTTSYVDTLPPAFTAGQQVEYQVVAVNNAGESAASNTLASTVGGAGGTGLKRRIWDSTTDTAISNDIAAGPVGGRTGEPAVVLADPTDPNSARSPLAPVVDDVEGVIPNTFTNGAPDITTRDIDTFAIEWVGEIQAEETKAYNFSFITDDGGRLFINDQEVINNGWRDQGDTEYFAEPINLTAGQKVKVRFEQYEQGGGATARLRWNGPGNTREDVPVTFMFPTLGAEDATAQIPYRAPSNLQVFGMPGNSETPAHIDIHWQDNAFGEVGYELQRATDSGFTQNLFTVSGIVTDPLTSLPVEAIPTGSNLYTDTGTDPATGTNTPLDPNTTYFYRLRPIGSTTWTVAGSAKPVDRTLAGTDLTISKFTQQNATTNGWANITAPGSVTLTEAVNNREASVWVNRAFDIDTQFTTTFDFRINTGTADGMAFVIQNSTPPDQPGVDPTPVRALGGGGGAKGWAAGNLNGNTALPRQAINNSVALLFDIYNGIDQVGIYTPGSNSGDTNPASYVNDPANWPLAPNGTINLQLAGGGGTGQAGTGTINLNSNVIFRVKFIYDNKGNNNGTPDDPSDDSGLVTLEFRRADAAAGSAPLIKTQYAVDLATAIGGPIAAMGFTAATGGANAKQEVFNFSYDGPVNPGAPVSSVYVRGSSWLGADTDPNTETFKEYLQDKGLGNSTYGYKLFDAAGTNNANDIIPWINVDEIVVQFAAAPSGAGIPTTGEVLTGVKLPYTVSSVTQLDPQTYVLHLDKPLGGAGTTASNGEKVRLTVPGGGAAGADFSMVMNIVQGDVNKSTSVLANDYSEVKARFFKNTKSPVTGTNDYDAFHDVDGSGSILANDYSAVKARFFQSLPGGTPASAAAALFSTDRIAEEVLG